jgi:hypothetical protein
MELFRCVTKDLLFTYDGNPDFVNDLINVSKLTKMAELVYDFTSRCDIPYMGIEEEGDENKWNLLDFTPFTDEELAEWSKMGEPLDKEKKIIELFERQLKLQEELEQMRRTLELTQRKLDQVLSLF